MSNRIKSAASEALEASGDLYNITAIFVVFFFVIELK